VDIRKRLTRAGLDAGAESIAWHLKHTHKITLHRATIHRIPTRHDLVTPEPAKRPRSSCIRFQADQLNDCLAVRLHPLRPQHARRVPRRGR